MKRYKSKHSNEMFHLIQHDILQEIKTKNYKQFSGICTFTKYYRFMLESKNGIIVQSDKNEICGNK